MKEILMNTPFGKSQSIRLFCSAFTLALSLVPGVAQAQTGNTMTGFDALVNTTTGSYNTADGYAALYANPTGAYNTASGYEALFNTTAGYYNTADGNSALYANTSGY